MINRLSYLWVLLLLASCTGEPDNAATMTEQQRRVQAEIASQSVVEGDRQIYQQWFNHEGHLVQEELWPASLQSPFNETWLLFPTCDTALTPGNLEVIEYHYDSTSDYREAIMQVRGCPVQIQLENVMGFNGLLSKQIYRDTSGNEIASRMLQYKQPGLLEQSTFIVHGDTLFSSFYLYNGDHLTEMIRHNHQNHMHLSVRYGRDGLPVEAFEMEGEEIIGYFQFQNRKRGEAKKAIQLLEPQ